MFQVEWTRNLVSSGVETKFHFEWSGNKISFRVEWKKNLVLGGNVLPFPDVFSCVCTHIAWLKLKDLATSSFPYDFPHSFVNDE